MRFICFTFVALAIAASTAHAVIVLGPQGRNTTQPTDKQFANSGWQYQGDMGDFLGTPIAPHLFITAQHVGYFPGTSFVFNGTAYTQIASFSEPDTDLRIIEVDGTLPAFAPLYTRKNERGKQVMLLGRGTDRGDPVLVKNHLRGWNWGADDHLQSWGINSVRSITASTKGDLLKTTFSPGASRSEGILSAGDSGGGMFIKDNGIWKLAGVNYGADGPFSFTGGDGSGFNAALLSDAGLYAGGDDHWTLHHSLAPSSAYASRISSNLTWIDSVLDGTTPPDAGSSFTPPISPVPEPATLTMIVTAIYFLSRRARFRRA